MSMSMSMTERIMHSTVRIVTTSRNGEGSGTGFFFKFLTQEDGTFFSGIVTNRHVIENARSIKCVFTIVKNDDLTDLTKHMEVTLFNIQEKIIYHPDADVDLAVIPSKIFLDRHCGSGESPLVIHLEPDLLLDNASISHLAPIENVSAVGYPDVLWDEVNNLPLIQSGRTASDLRKDFNGEKKFIIECSIYPGFSGSPVFLMDRGSFYHQGELIAGDRVALLGINSTVFINQKSISMLDGNVLTDAPNNLGIIIKAERILEFEPLIMSNMGIF
ncbi:hypothetical protein HCC18_16655 [Listeria booriae]|uniref:S1 family peptidase n=1 Tax=Listeria booriae TaxID=1552123 RepID=UPI00162AE3E3|nr:serine protease [Listeria booriae]MBC2318477.1 hypothetical protein [Listeria booriae]MCD2205552.1 trypsin-like peptidase domain-containing protein [Listeria booriae]